MVLVDIYILFLTVLMRYSYVIDLINHFYFVISSCESCFLVALGDNFRRNILDIHL